MKTRQRAPTPTEHSQREDEHAVMQNQNRGTGAERKQKQMLFGILLFLRARASDANIGVPFKSAYNWSCRKRRGHKAHLEIHHCMRAHARVCLLVLHSYASDHQHDHCERSAVCACPRPKHHLSVPPATRSLPPNLLVCCVRVLLRSAFTYALSRMAGGFVQQHLHCTYDYKVPTNQLPSQLPTKHPHCHSASVQSLYMMSSLTYILRVGR